MKKEMIFSMGIEDIYKELNKKVGFADYGN